MTFSLRRAVVIVGIAACASAIVIAQSPALLSEVAQSAGALSAPASPAAMAPSQVMAHGLLEGDSVPDVVVAPSFGPGPVRVLSGADGSELGSGFPFGPTFAGGVRVAVGDINGDGSNDIVTAMGLGGGLVSVFSGVDLSLIASGYPFGPIHFGGVHVATGDVNADGQTDIIVGGRGRVNAYNPSDLSVIASVAPFGPLYLGGVSVAAGDVDGDGHADIIAGQLIGGLAAVIRGSDSSTLALAAPYTPGFLGGIYVAAGDVNGDGRDDVVTSPGSGGGPVQVFDGQTAAGLGTFVAFETAYPGGVRIATTDLTGDGKAEIVVAPGPGGPPQVRVFGGSPFAELTRLYVYPLGFLGGVYVAAPSGKPVGFTSANQTTFTIGTPGTFTVQTTGTPAVTSITRTGTLPSGVTFTDNGNGTATLAGTPATGGGGSYPLTFTASNGSGPGVVQNFTLDVVDVAPTVTATLPVNGATGVGVDLPIVVTFSEPVQLGAGAFELQCPVGAPIAVTASPASPSTQFTLDPVTDLPVTSACSLRIVASQVTDVDADDPPDAMAADTIVSFTTSACLAISVSPTTVPGGNVSVPYGPVTFTQTGGTAPITWGVSTGTLPAGLTLASSTGVLSGTPTQSGPYNFTVTATAANGCTGSAALTLSIASGPNQAPSYTAGPNQTVVEDAGAISVPNWATAISPGPADEAAQLLTFSVTGNSDPALFAVAPAVSPTGTLTYTPAANANGAATITLVLQDNGGTAIGGVDTSAPQNFTITVSAVNDAPSFTVGADQTVNENAGAQTVPSWATAISAGPADEAGQTLTFAVTNNTNPALFSVAPAVSSTGTLTYTTAPGAAGTATVTLTLSDNGGTASGGIDTSAPQTFTITLTGVNTAPSFTVGADQTVLEDAGAQTVPGWATGISPGPADEAGQNVTFAVTGNTNAGLFSVAPAVSPTGALTYTPAANASGTATITLTLSDDGGTAGGGVDTSAPQNFSITVTAVNDAPSYTVGADQTASENAGAQSVVGWATAIAAGPADEAAQALTFTVTNNTNPSLFSAGPAVASNGTLTYTPATNASGTATITLTLSDNGGTANGGVDTSAPQQFTITLTPVNSAPSFTKGADQTIAEDAGAQTVPGWATAISPGPADESAQNVTFTVTGNTNPTLFSVAPAVSSTGTLTYTAAANAAGTATITLTLSDDGGTAGGGSDTSAPQSFVITVNGVNDAPSFTAGVGPSSAEDAGAQSIPTWATAISPGPASEAGQTLTFVVTGNTNPSLFSAGPAVSSTGTLTYTSAANAFGTADITLVLQDNGGTAGGGVDTSAPQVFTITVTPVNDAPQLTDATLDYTTVGNTQLHVAGATLAGLASTTDVGSVLTKAGPSDIDGPAAAEVVPLTNFATPNGGTVTLAADGSFTYVPDAGFTGVDTFTVQITDTVTPVNVSVSVTVANTVWYVNNQTGPNNAAGGDGRSTDAFESLADAATASGANDHIFVFNGDTGTTPLMAGIALKNGQKLYGEGIGLTVGATALVAAGTAPRLTAASDAITVTANTANGDRTGVEIRGFNITSGGNAIDVTSANSQNLGVRISENTVVGAATEGIDITQGSSGSAVLDIRSNTVTASGTGIDIQRTSGSVTITAFSDNVVSGNSGSHGIVIAGPVTFDATPGGGLDPVNGGTTVIGQSGNGVGGAGLSITNMSGALDFGDLDVFADGGGALGVTGTGAFNGASGTRITSPANASSMVVTGGPAVSLTNLTADLQLNAMSSANSAFEGVALTNVAGTFSAPSGSSITNATGTAFSISGGNANVTYNGTINDDVGTLVSIASTTGGTKSFTGAITDGGDGDGSGISLSGNAGATISFSGGLTLSTGANAAFAATGGGTVTVTDPPGPTSNTIATTSGTALNVANTTIGAAGLTFQSIASNGATSGIVLNATGGGSLTVSGTAGAGSGGTIQNSTGPGVNLTNTGAVNLSFMNIQNGGDDGIRGSSVAGLNLTTLNITSNGNAVGEAGIDLVQLTGSGSMAAVTVSGSGDRNVHIANTSGTLTAFNVTNSTFSNTNMATGDDGFLVENNGSGAMTVSITGSTFTDNKGDHFNASTDADATGTLAVTFSNNTLTTTPGNDPNVVGGGITLSPSGSADMTFTIDNNNIQQAFDEGINLNLGTASTAAASMIGTISNNIVGASGDLDSGSESGTGINVTSNGLGTTTVSVTNNQVYQYANPYGILLSHKEGSSTMNATVTGNTVANPGSFALNGVRVDSGATAGDSGTMCVALTGNTLAGSGPGVGAGEEDVRLRQRFNTTIRLPGYAGANNDTAAVNTFVSGGNPGGEDVSSAHNVGGGGGGFVGGAACPTPQ